MSKLLPSFDTCFSVLRISLENDDSLVEYVSYIQ